MNDLKACADSLHATLLAAMEERDRRPDFVASPKGTGDRLECEWVAYERASMHEAVNGLRAKRGQPEVPLGDILHVERQAGGLYDYPREFAFRCAQIVMR